MVAKYKTQAPMAAEENLLQFELIIDNVAESHLKETATWARFLAIIGFIISGLFALVGLLLGPIFSGYTKLRSGGNHVMIIGEFIMVFYIVIAIITSILSIYLYKFAVKMQSAFRGNDQKDLQDAFKSLKTYYRFIGILTIIYLACLFLGIIGFMIATVIRQ